jgi:hypothetical protein
MGVNAMSARTALNGIAFCMLALYLVLGSISFVTFVEPSLNGTNGWRAYGDSDVYMDEANAMRDSGIENEVMVGISLSQNFIVPATVGALLQTWTRVAICNIVIFIFSLVVLARTFAHIKWYVFLPIILASTYTYQALFTLNKEIFVFFSAIIMARWFMTRSPRLIIMLILFSMALRWEQAFIILFYLLIQWLRIPLKRAMILLIVGISVAIPFAMASVGLQTDVTKESSSALFANINLIESYGLYFVILTPKIAITLLSGVVQFWKPFVDPARLHDLNNGLFVIIDQICLCSVVIVTWRKRLWLKENPVIYFVLIYVLIDFAAPVNAARYLYLIYVLMATVLSSHELQSLRIHKDATTSPSGNRHKLSPGV